MEVADRDGNGMIDFEEFSMLFYDVELLNVDDDKNDTFNKRSNLYSIIDQVFKMGIDLEQQFRKYDPLLQGLIKLLDFKYILVNLPIGFTDKDIETILINDVGYSDNGKIDYVKIIENPAFKRAKLLSKLKDPSLKKEDIDHLIQNVEDDANYFEPQKVIIETIIYIDDCDIMIYTTVLPKTSTIFAASAKRTFQEKDTSEIKQVFTNKLLARLEGHRTSNPPTLCYVPESGCLVSGDKLEKRHQYNSNSNGNPLSKSTLQPFLFIDLTSESCSI